jgi:DNA-binding transcriptional regulator YiaG
MSTGLSLKEVLARPAEALEDVRVSSDIHDAGPTNRFALSATRIDQPVAVAKTLRGLGLSLRKAHDALNRLVEGETVVARLLGDAPTVGATLAAVGVGATEISLPRPEIKKIRESLGCSQAEFADRFGLELTTLQNWEQGRNALDGPSRILLAIIGQFPEVVDSILAQAGPEARALQPR